MSRESEEIECRECGTVFNLSGQWYYDNLCPECKGSADGEATTQPACTACGRRRPADAMQMATVRNRAAQGGTERVLSCSDACTDELEHRRLG